LELTIQVLQELKTDERLSEADPETWVAQIEGYIAELEARR